MDSRIDNFLVVYFKSSVTFRQIFQENLNFMNNFIDLVQGQSSWVNILYSGG